MPQRWAHGHQREGDAAARLRDGDRGRQLMSQTTYQIDSFSDQHIHVLFMQMLSVRSISDL